MLSLTTEGRIRLLISKSQIYRHNYLKSIAEGDIGTAEAWKKGYIEIRDKIEQLKED